MGAARRIVSHADLMLRRAPFLGRYFAWWRMAHLYPVEVRLLRGTQPPSRSEFRSLIHFSVNRAGTQFVRRILHLAAADTGVTPVSMNDVAYWTDLPFLDQLGLEGIRRYRHVFRNRGYVYSVFGGFVTGIEGLSEYSVLLAVRDPRDVLTSQYFSVAFGHQAPGASKMSVFRKARECALAKGIDRWVLEESAACYDVYDTYRRELLDKPYVHVARYEEMIADFAGWLEAALSFARLTLSSRSRDVVGRPAAPRSENKYAHRRQVQPGDHRMKLKASTVEELDDRLGPVLEAFGYPV